MKINRSSRFGMALSLLAFACLVYLRLHWVRRSADAYNGCAGCLDAALIVSDLRLLTLMVSLAALSWLIRIRLICGALLLVIVLIQSVYVVDLILFWLLDQRLRFLDLLRFSGEFESAWSVVSPRLLSWQGIWLMILTALSLGGVVAVAKSHIRPWPALTLLLNSSLVYLGSWTLPAPGYVHTAFYQDVLTHNLTSGVNQPFSENFKKHLVSYGYEASECIDFTPGMQRRSVILIVVESLSSYQSALFSGLMDLTPELDRLARENSYLEEFHANGFTTDGGLIALLTGQVPLPTMGRYESTKAFTGFERPVGEPFYQLQKVGYGTQFFAAHEVEFLDTDKWLSGLGIGYVEDRSHPYYKGLPKGSFSDAGDRALYDRYLQWYDWERKTKLNFSVLRTVTTHPPFVMPGDSHPDQIKTIRYADEQIGRFVRSLQKRGFFEAGILMITGDHRSMTPLTSSERLRFGEGAMSRMPAVVIGPSGLPRGRVSGRWQQTDFLPSLMAVTGLRSCVNRWQGRFMGKQFVPAQYVMQAQGDERDQVTVFAHDSKEPGHVILAGDNTRWATGTPAVVKRDEVIQGINHVRALRSPVEPDFIPLMLKWKLGQ